MNARLQSAHALVSPDDLALVLALTRAPTLADAATRLGVDSSTVFRSLQRVEKRLGKRLFERDRRGYHASELAQQLALHAEHIEGELEAARSCLAVADEQVSGSVRITTTDTLLYGLVMAVLESLMKRHPNLRFDLDASNELANLTRRDADIALRATRKPPEHLVGRRLGVVQAAVFAHKQLGLRPRRGPRLNDLIALPWAAPDEAMPDHLSVRWRRKHLPKVAPRCATHSILAVMEAVAAGLAVGIVPLFLARAYADVVPITEPLAECDTDLWLLAHPESRHLRRIAVVVAGLAEEIRLE